MDQKDQYDIPEHGHQKQTEEEQKEKALMQSMAEGPLQEEGASQGLASNMV